MDLPLISVIVPNYNHASYLRERLDSILQQEYQNLEILLFDDCSTDESVVILKNYLDHEKIKSIDINTSNSGSPISQWRKGVERAQGEFVWIAESDDVASPLFLSSLIDVLRNDSEVNLVYCQSGSINNKSEQLGDYSYIGNIFEENPWQDSFIVNGTDFVCHYLKRENVIPNASAVIMRKSSLLDVDWEYISTFRYAGDWLAYSMVLKKGKIAFVNKKLNYFRSHDHSSRQRKDIDSWKCYFSERNLVHQSIEAHFFTDCSDEYRKSIKTLHEYISLASRLTSYFNIEEKCEVVIYGAGNVGRSVFEILNESVKNVEVLEFIDQVAEVKSDLIVCGRRVVSLAEYVQNHKNIPILIGSLAFAEEIQQKLIGVGLGELIVPIIFRSSDPI